MLTQEKLKEIEKLIVEIRLETLKEIKHLGFGHIGGAASVIDTLGVLYSGVMNIDPNNPTWEDRDYLVVSKGHAGPSLYATLAIKGYFDKEVLKTLNQNGTNLPSHCDMNLTMGIDMTTGSLGQGMSTAIGITLGNKLDKKDNYTYLILGDGELNEGQIWEGAMLANHHKLDKLIAFVDENKKQLDGYTTGINHLGDITDKFRSFGWHAQYVDGHNPKEIYRAIEKAKQHTGRPSMIVLDTIKGYGYDFVANADANHHMSFGDAEHKRAEELINGFEKQLQEMNK